MGETFSGLISRVENLEQTSASGAAMSKRIDALEKRLTPAPRCGHEANAVNSVGGEYCELAQGHTGRHVFGISSWPQSEPKTCTARLYLQPRAGGSRDDACVLSTGHDGDHQDKDNYRWNIRYT